MPFFSCQQNHFQIPPRRRFCDGSSPGFSLRHEIVRAITQSAQFLKGRNALKEIWLAKLEGAPPHCSTDTWTTPLDWNLSNISHCIFNALQQTIGSGLLCTQCSFFLLFLTLLCSSPCSLTSLERHKQKRWFPQLGSIEYHKKKSLHSIFCYIRFKRNREGKKSVF